MNASSTSFNYSVDGVNMTISGWSDTYNNLSGQDTEIEEAALDRFGSGWGEDNNDECGESGGCSPAHSMDILVQAVG